MAPAPPPLPVARLVDDDSAHRGPWRAGGAGGQRAGSPGRAEGARGENPRGARCAAFRPEDSDRAAGDRRPALRGDWLLARHRRRHGEIAAGARPGEFARPIEGRMTTLTCAAV